jgi:glucose-1-phosphate cytidylyltransferase
MKVVILAGGFGSRLGEETKVVPKPMIEIGEQPVIWHIMKHYSHYGFNEFVILCGYKGWSIKEYFLNYFNRNSSVTIDLETNHVELIESRAEKWKVTCLDTGINSMTGGRIKQAKQVIGDEPFLLTYGDGVSNVNISELIESHQSSGKLLTMTAVQPAGRFGSIEINTDGIVTSFVEKPKDTLGWINGGFFVCENKVFDYITEGNQTIFERTPLENMAKDGQINCFKHKDFWKCMDTLADKKALAKLWEQGEAKWKIW